MTVSILFAVAGLLLHRRRLPLQNLFAVALLVLGSALLLEWSARRWQFPFAPLPSLGHLSAATAWIGVILVARRIAQLIFNQWRSRQNYGLCIFGTTVFVCGVIWGAAEWHLAGSLNWQNSMGRLCSAAAMILLIFPWLIVKRPSLAGSTY